MSSGIVQQGFDLHSTESMLAVAACCSMATLILVVFIVIMLVGDRTRKRSPGADGYYALERMASPSMSGGSGQLQIGGAENTVEIKLHYTNWCGFCKSLKPHWNKIRDQLNGKTVNGKKYILSENDEDVSKTEGITGYPTVVKRNSSGAPQVYRADSSLTPEESLRRWVLA